MQRMNVFIQAAASQAQRWMCRLLHLQLPGSSWLLTNHVCQALCNQLVAARSRDVGPGSEL